MIKLVQESQPEVEASLRDVFLAASSAAGWIDPRDVAARATSMLGRGCTAVLEAERNAWSRYRVMVRVQGQPITIASVELTQPT